MPISQLEIFHSFYGTVCVPAAKVCRMSFSFAFTPLLWEGSEKLKDPMDLFPVGTTSIHDRSRSIVILGSFTLGMLRNSPAEMPNHDSTPFSGSTTTALRIRRARKSPRSFGFLQSYTSITRDNFQLIDIHRKKGRL